MVKTSSPFPPNSSVVAYLRDSGHETQELSILEQERSIRTWCEENQLLLTHVFKDEARPGSSVTKRFAFIEMIDYFEKGSPVEKGVILWSMDRFARNVDDAQFYRASLRRLGYQIYSITDNIPDGPYAAVFEALIDSNSHAYLERMSVNISRGLEFIVREKGAIPGHPPPGFKVERIQTGTHRDGTPHMNARWVIDEDQAPMIREVFRLRASGVTVRTIHQRYHLFKNRSGYTHFFRNRIYIGELKYAEITVPDYCAPLIDQSTWEAVQHLNETYSAKSRPITDPSNPLNPRRIGGSFLLSGQLYCTRCNSVMQGKIVQGGKKKRNDYYSCRGHHDRMECDAPAIPSRDLESTVLQTIVSFIQDPELQAIREQASRDALTHQTDQRTDKLKILESSARDARRRIDNIISKIADDPDAPRSLLETLKKLEAEEKQHNEEIARLASIDRDVRAQTSPTLKSLSIRLQEAVGASDIQMQKAILRQLVDRVVAERDGDKIRGIVYMLTDLPPDVKKNDINVRDNSHQGHSSLKIRICADFYIYC